MKDRAWEGEKVVMPHPTRRRLKEGLLGRREGYVAWELVRRQPMGRNGQGARLNRERCRESAAKEPCLEELSAKATLLERGSLSKKWEGYRERGGGSRAQF